jgi:deoxyribonuclease V
VATGDEFYGANLGQLKLESYHRSMTKRQRSLTAGLLHRWDVDVSRAIEIQERLRNQLSPKNGLVFRDIRWIAGADVAYATGGDAIFGAIVVLSFPDLLIAEGSYVKGKVEFPYIPGLLSFREAPVLLDAFSLLKQCPDLILFDGQGIAHPRGFGLASHIGLLLGLPSVGCAKTRLVGEHRPAGRSRGSFSWLWFEGKKVGATVRTRADVKPLFVSPGNKITVQTAVRVVLAACSGYRLPEPIRRAHQLANRMKEQERDRGGKTTMKAEAPK